MDRRVTIPDDCVYEGYGNLYHDEAEVSPPLLDVGTHSDSGVMYPTLDHREAMRQLRTALCIDMPLQLKVLLPKRAHNEVTPSASSSSLPVVVKSNRLVCPSDATPLRPLPLFSSSGTEYEIDRMRSQCRFLRDWLMCHENSQERVAARELVRTAHHLMHRETVEELLRRTEGVLQQLECWPVVVRKVRSQRGDDWDDATTLTELGEFARNILRTREICTQLAELTVRFSLLAPLVEEAAFRAAALDEIEQWSSESTVSSLRTLQRSVHEWKEKVAEDQQIIFESSQMLMDRIAAVKKKKSAELK